MNKDEEDEFRALSEGREDLTVFAARLFAACLKGESCISRTPEHYETPGSLPEKLCAGSYALVWRLVKIPVAGRNVSIGDLAEPVLWSVFGRAATNPSLTNLLSIEDGF